MSDVCASNCRLMTVSTVGFWARDSAQNATGGSNNTCTTTKHNDHSSCAASALASIQRQRNNIAHCACRRVRTATDQFTFVQNFNALRLVENMNVKRRTREQTLDVVHFAAQSTVHVWI